MNKTNNNQTHDLNGRCPTISRYGIDNLKSGKDPDVITCKFCRRKIEKIKMAPTLAKEFRGQNTEINVPDNIFTSGDINPLPKPKTDHELLWQEDALAEVEEELTTLFHENGKKADLSKYLSTITRPLKLSAFWSWVLYLYKHPEYKVGKSLRGNLYVISKNMFPELGVPA